MSEVMSVKIQLSAPRGVGPDGEGFSRFVELPCPPREGETVYVDDRAYRVHAVAWYPYGSKSEDERGPFVYVVLR